MTDRQDLIDRLVAERFAPPIRQPEPRRRVDLHGTARLIAASTEAAWVRCEGCGHLADPDAPCPTCRKDRP